jgi:hypothetical protein
MFKDLPLELYECRLNSKDIEKLQELVSDFYKIPKETLEKVKVRFTHLPEIWLYVIKRIGNYIQIVYRPIEKTLGLCNPKKGEIFVEERLPFFQKIKTLIHEYTHIAQYTLGMFSRKSKKELEEEADKVSDYLSKIYTQASQKFPSSSSYLILI